MLEIKGKHEDEQSVKIWLVYEEWFKLYSDAEVGRLITALLKFAATGEDTEFSGNEKFIWPALKRDVLLDREHQKEGRYTPEYKAWRKAVFERDNFTCQICGKVGGRLNAHHIERYRNNIERRTDITNGVTLCEKCHRLLHKEEGM